MLTALQILFSPESAWTRMLEKEHRWVVIFVTMLLPLLLLTTAVEGYALLQAGEQQTEFGQVKLSPERVQKYLVVYAGASLLIVFVGTAFLRSVAVSFNVQSTYSQCFAVLAYSYSPVLTMHFLDAIPAIPSWICWGIGVTLACRSLYHGVAVGLKPEQTKGFGVLLFAIVFVVTVSAFAHLAGLMTLRGNVWP